MVAAALALALAGAGGVGLPAALLRAAVRREDVWLVRVIKAAVRARARRLHAPRGAGSVSARWAITVPAIWLLGLRVGSDFMPRARRGRLPAADLAARRGLARRRSTASTTASRTFCASSPRWSTWCAAPAAPSAPKTRCRTRSPTCLIVLRKERSRARRAGGRHAGRRRPRAGRDGRCSPRRSACASTRAWAAHAADLSVRIFGPDLDVLGDAGRARRAHRSASRRARRRARGVAWSGMPQLRIAGRPRRRWRASALTPGDVIARYQVALAGAQTMGRGVVGERRFELVVRAGRRHRSDVAAHPRPAGRRPRRHQHAAGPSWHASTQSFGPGAVKREAQSRRIALEANVSGPRSRLGAAAELRRRCSPSSSCRTGYFVAVGGKVESQARATRSMKSWPSPPRWSWSSCCSTSPWARCPRPLVILATLPDALRGRRRRAAARGGRHGTCRRWWASSACWASRCRTAWSW
jgi:hypothetical protein